jgi:thiol-disulfide isomerase/thioredoxin
VLDRSFKGSRAPDLVFADPKGAKLQLSSLAGQPFLLNLWATWCAPCVIEMPMLDKLAADQKGKLRVITVSQDMQGAEAVAPFFAKSGFRHLEPWLDPENNLGFHFGGASLPMTVLYDSQGREVWRMAGGHDWTSKESAALIGEALAR